MFIIIILLLKQYEIKHNKFTGQVKVIKKPITFSYEKSDMDKYLMNTQDINLIQSYGLELPSYYKDKSLEELREAFEKSAEILTDLKEAMKNVAKYDYKSDPGKIIAYPKSKNPSVTTLENIRKHHIMEVYKYNLDQLRVFKEKTGTGIIHLNNPLQLLNRLELLIGSILAGNNGVLQDFSQIAHLLHQMKVIPFVKWKDKLLKKRKGNQK